MKDYMSALRSKVKALEIRLGLYRKDHPETADSYYSIEVTHHEMKSTNQH